jgi:hypothetical protein
MARVSQVRALCLYVSLVAQRYVTVMVLPRCGALSLSELAAVLCHSLVVTSVSARLFVVFVALSPAGTVTV